MNSIIVFLKNFNLIPVKTRLSKQSSKNFAKNFYINSIKDIFTTVKKVKIPYFLFWYPEPLRESNNNFSQQGKDLGERMYNAFFTIFNKSFEKAVIIGSDIPQISNSIIIKAFNLLENYDYILGPCYDGGYYLIGTKRDKLNIKIFKNIDWSTDKVLSQTVSILKNLNYSYCFLEKLHDIDTIYDLKIFFDKYKNSDLNSVKFLKHNYENFSNYTCFQ